MGILKVFVAGFKRNRVMDRERELKGQFFEGAQVTKLIDSRTCTLGL